MLANVHYCTPIDHGATVWSMISRGTIALLVSLLVLFGVSAWVAYTYRAGSALQQQYAQPGWCCMLQKRTCVVAESLSACEAQGGATFDWDRSSCDVACHPPVRRGNKKKAATSVPLPP